MSNRPNYFQVSAGANGAGYVVIKNPAGNAVGYCLAIASPRETPNGTQWPVPGTSTSYIEYWWFKTKALKKIENGTQTALTFESFDLVPANPGSPPTLENNPLVAIPAQFGTTPYVEWTTAQAPTWLPGTSPTYTDSLLKLMANSDGSVSCGWKYTGSGSSLALVKQFWGRTGGGNFWFGSQPGSGTGATIVNGDFSAVTQYPATTESYDKTMMSLDPSSVPLG